MTLQELRDTTGMSPNAIGALMREGFEEAEAVATLPDAFLLGMKGFGKSSLVKLREWQLGAGIAIPVSPTLTEVSGAIVATLREPALLSGQWPEDIRRCAPRMPPRTPKEWVAHTTYQSLLQPREGQPAISVAEAVKKSWEAAEEWEKQFNADTAPSAEGEI